MKTPNTEVHLIYTGIVALVPKYRSVKPHVISTVRILFPEGRSNGHFCWLGCVRDQVLTDDTDLEEYSGDPCKAGLVAYKPYGNMVITNSLIGKWNPFSNGKTQKDVLNVNRSDNDPYVASLDRSHLKFFNTEKLRLRSVASDGSFDVTYIDEKVKWVYHHKKSNPANYRSLAQEVCHRFEIPKTESFKLKFGLEGKESHLTFKSGQERVVVVIGNTPEKDILCTKSMPAELDYHVRLYNRLARATVNNLNYLVNEEVGGKEWKCHEHGWAENRRYKYRVTAYLPDDESTEDPEDRSRRVVHGANCPPGWWEEDDF